MVMKFRNISIVNESHLKMFRMCVYPLYEYLKAGDARLASEMFEPMNNITMLMTELRFMDINDAGKHALALEKGIECLGQLWALKILHYMMDVPCHRLYLFKQSKNCISHVEDYFEKMITKLQRMAKDVSE